MNTRILATFILTVASVAGAQAQVELPNQWLDLQMKAAKQDPGARGRNAAAAAAANATATPAAAHHGESVLTQQVAQSAANVAGSSQATQK